MAKKVCTCEKEKVYLVLNPLEASHTTRKTSKETLQPGIYDGSDLFKVCIYIIYIWKNIRVN